MFRNTNKKIILAWVAFSCITLALAWVVFFWESTRIKDLSEEYQKEKLNAYVLQEKQKQLNQLKRNVVSLDEEKNKLAVMFVGKEETLSFLKMLETAAAASSCSIKLEPVDISKIKFESAAPTKKTASEEDEDEKAKSAQSENQEQKTPKTDEIAALKDYPAFKIEVSGSFVSTLNFLKKLENMPYFTKTLKLDVVESKKNQTNAGGGSFPAAGEKANKQVSENAEDKNVLMTLVTVVYGK